MDEFFKSFIYLNINFNFKITNMTKFFIAALATLLTAGIGVAQEPGEDVHSDIEFGYNTDANGAPTSFGFDFDEFTSDGIGVAEGSYSSLFLAGSNDFFSDNPGFITALDEGLSVGVGDEISVRFLNAGTDSRTNFGTGFVNFYNPETTTTSLIEEDFGRIRIFKRDNGDVGVFDGGELVSGTETLLLAAGSDGTTQSNAAEEDENRTLAEGEIHNHIVFDLQGDEDVGAYGLLFQLEADFAGTDGPDGVVDLVSDPIWLIHNNGLDEDVFELQALPAFGVAAVPEPTTGVILAAASAAILTRRRRRI